VKGSREVREQSQADRAGGTRRDFESGNPVLSLQRAAGNAALSGLLYLQRQDVGTAELSDETAALLDRIFGRPPEVEGYEAIVGAESEQGSTGELTRRADALWRRRRIDFAEAFRQAAGQRGRAPVSSQTAASNRSYEQRWGLILPVTRDVAGVDEHLIPGSPFQQALRGSFTRVLPTRRNPSRPEMLSRIANGIHDLWLALSSGGVGQLVVNFQGHGDAGGIFGADGSILRIWDLDSLGRRAAALRVHLVLILDACDSGPLIGTSQEAQLLAALRQTRGQASGRGTPRWALAGPGRVLLNAGWNARVSLRSIAEGRDANSLRTMRSSVSEMREAARALGRLGTQSAAVERLQEAMLILDTYAASSAAATRGRRIEQGWVDILLRPAANMLDASNDLIVLLLRDVTRRA
jgi:hypothetical protein